MAIVAVTGGGSGIGAACARAFAGAGAVVAVIDRDLAAAEAEAAAIGGRAFRADVGEEADLEACAARVEEELGPVAVLVNSAGIIQRALTPHELTMETWDDVTRIDQRGTYVASRAFARAMIARRRGAIVNIASMTGSRSVPLHAYAPAKAAVIAMTACLAAEWGPAGIRVNSVSPGFTATPALQAAIDRGERDVTLLERHSALGRMVTTQEVAQAVLFLASDDASGITGIDLPVDCGWLAATSWVSHGGVRAPAA